MPTRIFRGRDCEMTLKHSLPVALGRVDRPLVRDICPCKHQRILALKGGANSHSLDYRRGKSACYRACIFLSPHIVQSS